jgi:membrane complex biogenesis BtpA family protein
VVKRETWLESLFGAHKPLIGVVHLPPLPGAPEAGAAAAAAAAAEAVALRDTAAYLRGGADGVLVENFGDAPFRGSRVEPSVVAALARAAAAAKGAARGAPVGVNVLRNDALAALGIAAATGLEFLRVNVLCGVFATDQGLIQGEADELLRERARLRADVRIFADVDVKHAAPLRRAPRDLLVEEMLGRGRADALLVTGVATGRAPELDALREVKGAAGTAPVLVASGVDEDNVTALAGHADGFLVGSSLKRGGRTDAAVELARVRRLVARLRRLR